MSNAIGLSLKGIKLKFTRVTFLSLVLVVFFMSSTVFAQNCKETFKAPPGKSTVSNSKLPDDTELNVYRFFSNKNTNSSHLASFSLIDGYFYATQAGTLSIREQNGSSEYALLERLQNFSTHIMEKSGQLSETAKAARPELLGSIDPHQVSFIELTRPVKKDVWAKDKESYPKDVISDRPDYSNSGDVHIRQAGLWIVAGQYSWSGDRADFVKKTRAEMETNVFWKTETPFHNNKAGFDDLSPYKIYFGMQAMPWQRSAEIMQESQLSSSAFEPAVYLDRNKYPIVFEVGRLAQVHSRYSKSLYETAVSMMVQDVEVMLKGKISEAFVFARALNKGNARRMQRMGFKILEGSCVGESCVLVQPLSDLVEKFGVATNSYATHRLQKHFPSYNGAELLRGMRWVKTSQEAQLDFIIEDFGFMAKEPIILHDFSKNLQVVMQTLGMLDRQTEPELIKTISLMNELAAEAVNDRSLPQISDQIPAKSYRKIFTDLNAIRLTNLDPALAHNPWYIPSLLMSLEGYLARNHEELGVVADVEEMMDSLDLNFVIQTTEPAVAQAARAFNMSEVGDTPAKTNKGDVYTFVVPRSEIVFYMKNNLPKSQQDFFARQGLDRGFWFFRTLSADPVIF